MSDSKNMFFLIFCRGFYWCYMVACMRKEETAMDAKKIGSFLKTLRKEKGLTQEQLAEILYVSGRTVSRWETGTSMPELGILFV